MKKALALALCVVICATALISGTVAFFTDEETKENVFGVGYVDIVQHEQEREGDTLVDFKQDQKLYPMVDNENGDSTVTKDFDGTPVNLVNPARYGGYLDKIVTVENEGKDAAYIRNIVAVPTGDVDEEWLHVHFGDAKNGMNGNEDWAAPYKVEDVEIGGKNYDLYVFDYIGAEPAGTTPGHFQSKDKTVPTLLGFWLDEKVDFEEKIVAEGDKFYEDTDGNGQKTDDETVEVYPVYVAGVTEPVGAYYYPLADGSRAYIDLDATANSIFVATQAVQVDGFATFNDAFTNTFGASITKDNHPWKELDNSGNQGGASTLSAGGVVGGVSKPWAELVENGKVVANNKSLTYIASDVTDLTITSDVVSAINTNSMRTDDKKATSLVRVTIGDGVTVNANAFSNFLKLKEVTISGDAILSEGGYQFTGCDALETVTLKDGLKNIPVNCFFGCSQLSNITIPASIESIGNSAFTWCAIEEIQLPLALKGIDEKTIFNHTPAYENNKITYA